MSYWFHRKNIISLLLAFFVTAGGTALGQILGHILGRSIGELDWMFWEIVNYLKPIIVVASSLQIVFLFMALFLIYNFAIKNRDWTKKNDGRPKEKWSLYVSYQL